MHDTLFMNVLFGLTCVNHINIYMQMEPLVDCQIQIIFTDLHVLAGDWSLLIMCSEHSNAERASTAKL